MDISGYGSPVLPCQTTFTVIVEDYRDQKGLVDRQVGI